MSTNYRFFGKKQVPIRMHMDEPNCCHDLATALSQMILSQQDRPLVIICIGTDRSTGDALGPLVGSKLESFKLKNFHVYGTLEQPVHAVNMVERLEQIYAAHNNAFVVAIDACLGKLKSVGQITLAQGPVQPGSAVKKELPAIGDIHLTGIVNIGGMMEFFVLQNTRLFTVMKMAEQIATTIQLAHSAIYSPIPKTFLEATRLKLNKQHQKVTTAFNLTNKENYKL